MLFENEKIGGTLIIPLYIMDKNIAEYKGKSLLTEKAKHGILY